ncbi:MULTISPECIES: DUF4351 domain-containing protein [unclassified Nostoc]
MDEAQAPQEDLSEAILDFTNLADLRTWLEAL